MAAGENQPVTECLDALYDFLNCAKDEKAQYLEALNAALDRSRSGTDFSREEVLAYLRDHCYETYARARRARQKGRR